MRIGVTFPSQEIGTDPAAIRDFAQAVDEMGFDHISVLDHVLQGDGTDATAWAKWYTIERCFHEPLVLFGFLAAATRRIGLSTAVLILPQRPAALVAKQAAEADILSGGRVRLGVGIGWNAIEFEGLHQEFRTRGRRIAEQVEVMRRLWTERTVDFRGQHHVIPAAGINPRPVQQPIPVWFGAFEDIAMKRTAEVGDGWFPNPRLQPGPEAEDAYARLRGHLEGAGRDVAGFGVNPTILANRGDEGQWSRDREYWQGLGSSHATFRTIDAGIGSLDAHLAAMRRFAENNPLS